MVDKNYYECGRCNITSLTEDRMCPCPRGGCEATIVGTYKTVIKKDKMTIKQINETYDMLSSEIYAALDLHIDPNNLAIIYELDQESIDNGDYEYYVDCYGRDGATYELSVESVLKNGEVNGYNNVLGESWKVYASDIHNIADKLTILNILSNAK